MAKSARASGIKKNKAVLKKRVFGPVETARNERLNAKLLELAKQPKPDVEITGMLAGLAEICLLTLSASPHDTDPPMPPDAKPTATAKETEGEDPAAAEGAMFSSLSFPIPPSLFVQQQQQEQHQTPVLRSRDPSTADTEPHAPPSSSTDDDAAERLFYHALGITDDILGFNIGGHLLLSFNNVAAAPPTTTVGGE